MVSLFLSFLGTAAALTFWEFIKQMGVRAVESFAPTAVVKGIKIVDQLLPSLIEEGVNGSELENRIRKELGSLTGSEWKKIRSDFDPAVFLDTLLTSK